MSWARHAKEALGRGETVHVRPRGHSMKGKVKKCDLVTRHPARGSVSIAATTDRHRRSADACGLLRYGRDREWLVSGQFYGRGLRPLDVKAFYA